MDPNAQIPMEQVPETMEQTVARLAAEMALVRNQNNELNARVLAQKAEMETLQASQASRGTSSGSSQEPKDHIVQKWAPDPYDSDRTQWPHFSLKFKNFLGAMLQGQVGRWLDKVDKDREKSALIGVLGEDCRATSSLIYSSLIAICTGIALTLAKQAGNHEGLEAWRLMLKHFEPQNKQTKVVAFQAILAYKFDTGTPLLEAIVDFEERISKYEVKYSKVVDDDTKVGTVIKGLPAGSIKEHMLLRSEQCGTYAAFRSELETVALAQSSSMSDGTPMDIGAIDAVTQGKTKCTNCGKLGHTKEKCWAPGGGKAKKGKGGGKKGGGGKAKGKGAKKRECYQCGMTNHISKDCQSSQAK